MLPFLVNLLPSSRSLSTSSGELEIGADRKMEKTSTKSYLAWWFMNTSTKKQSSVTKCRASLKMSLTQNKLSEILID